MAHTKIRAANPSTEKSLVAVDAINTQNRNWSRHRRWETEQCLLGHLYHVSSIQHSDMIAAEGMQSV